MEQNKAGDQELGKNLTKDSTTVTVPPAPGKVCHRAMQSPTEEGGREGVLEEGEKQQKGRN